jgi:hypothetical protein
LTGRFNDDAPQHSATAHERGNQSLRRALKGTYLSVEPFICSVISTNRLSVLGEWMHPIAIAGPTKAAAHYPEGYVSMISILYFVA